MLRSGNGTNFPQPGDYAQHSPYTDVLARKRLRAVVERVSAHILRTHTKSLKILDLGCGIGGMTFPLSHMGHEVTGVDVDGESIKMCQSKNYYPHARYLAGDIATLNLRERFDVVICSEVIEHSTYPERLLETIRNHLGPDGIGIITVPNGYSAKEIMLNRLFRRLGITALFHKLPNKLYRALTGMQSPYHSLNISCGHVQFFTLRKIARLLDEKGFQVLDVANLDLGIFLDWKCLRLLKRLECKLADYVPHAIAGGWVFVVTRR